MDTSSPDLGRSGRGDDAPGQGSTPPPPPEHPGPSWGGPAGPPPAQHGSDAFFAAIRRSGLYRSDDRWIGGVAGGLGARFGIDPLLVRAIFAISSLLGGLGLVAYGVGWALLPEQRDGRIHLEETIRGRFDVALLGGVAFVLVGFGRGDSWGWGGGGGQNWLNVMAWVATCAVVVAVVLIVRTSRSSHRAEPRPWAAAETPGDVPGSTGSATSKYAPYSTAYTAPAAQPYQPSGATSASAAAPASGYDASSRYAPASAYGASSPYSQPAQYGAAYAPSTPTPAPPDRVRGPGAAMTGGTVALMLLTLAGLLAASRGGLFDGEVLLTAACVSIILCGLAITIAGLRGRSSGVLGFVAVVTMVLTIPAAVTLQDDWRWGTWSGAVTDETFVPTSRSVAATGYSMGVGDSTIDLREVPLTSTTLTVPVQLGVGDLTIVVPEGAAVTANVQSGVGDVRWDVDDADVRLSGVGTGNRSFSSEEVADGAHPRIALDVSVGAGSVTIEEAP